MTDYPNDGPLLEVAADAEKYVQAGSLVFQKFTCGACGARQTMEEPNKFFTSGRCEECKTITVITKCGYLLVASLR